MEKIMEKIEVRYVPTHDGQTTVYHKYIVYYLPM